MTSKEIFLSTFLFVASFIATELMVSGLSIENPVHKFFFRIIFLGQYSILIYFIFDYLENKSLKNVSDDCTDTEPDVLQGKNECLADTCSKDSDPDKEEKKIIDTSAKADMIPSE